ncbi:MAG: hypothetical protein J3T61_05820, partial [Candidatus Brocadiales bacterium]|nr:hypothetical protein [Candidatus Bathyanammoxibius sp.]
LSDIAIELPTGAGKTLIALLILEYWRKQGKKVAILTGNKTLARQIEDEADDLRVSVVRFEGSGDLLLPKDLRAYDRSNSIGIMNYWVYINQRPSVAPADILVLDDAQLAEGALLSLFSVRIGHGEHSSLFTEAMRLIEQYTDSPVADDFVKNVEQGPWGPTDLVPFPNFIEMHEELEALVEEQLASAGNDSEWKNLKYSWGRLRPNLQQALLFLSSEEIVLRPYIFPSLELSHLKSPIQRIYMSATLHDPNDLQRRLGTPPIKKLDIPSSLCREEDGRRLFIFNQTSSLSSRNEPTEEVLVPLRGLLSTQKKSVWLCSSRYEAKRWRSWLNEQLGEHGNLPPTWELTSTGSELENFCSVAEGHLFVAGRFEGMDFPNDTCRLAVFPSLPRATGALERFVTEQLKDATFQKTRMLERIKQGIGRCTRGNEDFAVYYFLDARFYAEMESKAFSALQSERTCKQIELGLELTQDGLGAVVPFARTFLKGNFKEFDKRESEVSPPSVEPTQILATMATVSEEVEGWRALFGTHDFENASRYFEGVSSKLEDAEREHRGFWKYMEAFAEYLRYKLDDQPAALDVCLSYLERAIKEGGSSSWFNRLRKTKNKLSSTPEDSLPITNYDELFDRWDELAEKYPLRKGRFLKWLAVQKAYLEGTHKQVCATLETLGYTLGYNATRPEGDGAPDGLWVTRDHAITIEAKIDVKRDSVSLSDVNQADGHRRGVMKEQSLNDAEIASVIVTSMKKSDRIASTALGDIRILPLELVSEIQTRLEQVMRGYWRGWLRDNAAVRTKLRRAAFSSLPPNGWFLRVLKNARAEFVEEEELFKEWPS